MSQVSPEEGGAGGQDELVGLDLFLLARDRHIKKVLLIPQFLERLADVPLEVVPLKTKFIPWPHVDTSKIRVTTTSANVTLIKIFTTYLILNSIQRNQEFVSRISTFLLLSYQSEKYNY